MAEPRRHCAASACAGDAGQQRARRRRDVLLPHQALADEERTHAEAASRSRSAWVKMPLSAMTMRSGGTQRRQTLGGGKRGGEGLEVAVVDADQLGVELKRAVKLGLVMHLGEHVHAEIGRAASARSRAVASSTAAMMMRMQSAPSARASST